MKPNNARVKGPFTLRCEVYPGTQPTYWVYVPAQVERGFRQPAKKYWWRRLPRAAPESADYPQRARSGLPSVRVCDRPSRSATGISGSMPSAW